VRKSEIRNQKSEIPRSCLVIGEVAQAHDGSLGMAHAFIDAIADAGADAVKFQTHIAAAESTRREPWRVKFSSQDSTRYDYWKRMEFSEEQWHGLKQHASQRKLLFLSSPFSNEAVELLGKVGVYAWKVASGEISNSTMFEKMAATGLPIFLSTGMSTLEEIDQAVSLVKSYNVPLTVMQCTSMYPCPPEKIGLHMIPLFRERYGCAVGFSDHSGKIYAGLAAVSLGIEVLEVHVTLSREMFGPDVAVSLTTQELRQLVDGIRFIEKAISNPVNKDAQANEAAPLRSIFTKSVVARVDLPVGTVLGEQHLAAKKPGTGLPASQIPELIGTRLKRSLKTDEMVLERDLEVLS
jgi:N,N'-diacetyllegionaminate synthase